MSVNIQSINPLEIETTAGTQARASIKTKTVEEYAADMKNGDLFPSVVVYAEEGSERYVLADGFHRLQAHIAAFQDTKGIQCDVREGSIFDAKVYAAGSNHDHGTRRSTKDVHNAIRMLLLDAHTDQWANTSIADAAKCNHKTVAKVREKMITDGEIGEVTRREHKKGGKTVVADVPKGTSKKDKAKAEGKDKKKDKETTPTPTVNQEGYDREELIRAFTTINSAVCSGAEALKKYDLAAYIPQAEKAADWLDDLVSSAQEDDVTDDDAAFLKVS